jgi:hypothetical protein
MVSEANHWPLQMTVLEIRPHPWGWKVFEASGVEPVVPERNKMQSTTHRTGRASIPVKFGFWIRAEQSNASFRLMKRVENCNARPPASALISSKSFQPQAPRGNTGGPIFRSTLSPQRPAVRRFHA